MIDEPDLRGRRVRFRLARAAWACVLVAGAVCWAAAAEPLSRDQFVGAWRLVRIEYSGPNGAHVDPFYQAGSTGLLIYDPTGWMSVHIVGPDRRAFRVPPERLAPSQDPAQTAMKAAAFDSFYAYDGTWDFNPATSELVHHVVSSLLPAEAGVTYTQQVTLDAGRLVFSNRSGRPGAETLRRKIWERAETQAVTKN
jgi:hypothetical protein